MSDNKKPINKNVKGKDNAAAKISAKGKKQSNQRISRDASGKVITKAAPITKRAIKDQNKTSVAYTALSILMYVLAIVPLVGVTVFLAVKTYTELPAYGFWHFIAVILMGVFAIIFTVVTLIVTRKKSKSSIFSQTAKVAFTYVCLTTVFGLLLTYLVPDIIAKATSSTLFAEDLFYNADDQIEQNASIERDFIIYNVLNGNLNDYDESGMNLLTQTDETTGTVVVGDYSYATLSKLKMSADSSTTMAWNYANFEINQSFQNYLKEYGGVNQLPTDSSQISAFDEYELYPMQEDDPDKYAMYQCIYNNYILCDFNYALSNNIGRRCLAMSILDYIYAHSHYTAYLEEGFGNKRLQALCNANYDNFNQDGYNTFDDPLLLYAQLEGRMTVPVILRLILNGGWSYSQSAVDPASGKIEYSDEGELLYQLYDPDARDAYVNSLPEGESPYGDGETTLAGFDGKFQYGRNADGWLIFQNGYVKRPMSWTVLDMQGTNMDVAAVDIGSITIDLGSMGVLPLPTIINMVLGVLPGIKDGVGGLLTDDLGKVIGAATGGGSLGIGICVNDDTQLAISIMPTNVKFGQLGYQWMTWMQSNNLLMAVINVLNVRNWLYIFGGIGVLLIVAAGVLRECGRRTRERTEVVRDRIMRANAADAQDLNAIASKEAAAVKEHTDTYELDAAGLAARGEAKKNGKGADKHAKPVKKAPKKPVKK